jgi:lysophospholipase L1-like esterase
MATKPVSGPDVPVIVLRHFHPTDHQAEWLPDASREVSANDIRARHEEANFVVLEEHAGRLDILPRTGYASESVRKMERPGANAPLPEVVPGVESYSSVTAHGEKGRPHHAGVVNVSEEQQFKSVMFGIRDGEPPAQMKAKVERMGGALIFNHPQWPYTEWFGNADKALDYQITAEEAQGYHGVEVFNDTLLPHEKAPVEVLKWTERNFFDRGLNPAVVSGTDDHGHSYVAERATYTVALAPRRDIKAVVAAIRAAKTYVTTDEKIELTDFAIDEHGLGSRPTLRTGTKHKVSLHLSGLLPSSTVQVIYNGKDLLEGKELGQRWPTKSTFKADIPFVVEPGKDGKHGHVYVRVLDPTGNLTLATSAIMFDAKTPEPADKPIKRDVDFDWLSKKAAQELHEKMLSDPARQSAEVVFLGDSITWGWTEKAADIWKKHFAKYQPLNLGIPGDQTQNMLWRLREGHALAGVNPKVVVVLAGVNNLLIGEHTPDETVNGIKAVIREIKEQAPEAKILLLGVLPAHAPTSPTRKAIRKTNKQLEELTRRAKKAGDTKDPALVGVEFLDLRDKLVDKHGAIAPATMGDGLHPEYRGYKAMGGAIAGKLRAMIKTDSER